MSEEPPRDREQRDGASFDAGDVGTTATSSAYKVLGAFDDPDGAGVLGSNAATTGTPVGVEGSVADGSDGYGLYTEDDAAVEGVLEAPTIGGGGSDVTVAAGESFTAQSGVRFSSLTGGLLEADGSGNVAARSMITDGQHGNRSGGSLHATATTLTAGFMSPSDKSRLDGDVVEESGDTMTGTLAFSVSDGTNALDVDAGAATVDGAGNATFGGTLDLQGGTLTNSTGGLTVTTGAGDLTLSPSSRVAIPSPPSQEGGVLTVDSNGNVGESADDTSYTGVAAATNTTVSAIDPATRVPFVTTVSGTIDSEGTFDDSNNQYAIPQDGVYSVSPVVSFDPDGIGTRELRLLKNGTGIFDLQYSLDGTNGVDRNTLTFTGTFEFVANDTVAVEYVRGDPNDDVLSGSRLSIDLLGT